MQVVTANIEREKAAELYQQYKAHRHYSTPVDDEIRRAYREIARGKVVIQAIESIKQAGLGDGKLPKLAIARADAPHVAFAGYGDGSGKFSWDKREFWARSNSLNVLEFPAGSFNGVNITYRKRALMPLIPVHLRPRTALEEYHVLWEAEWEPIPPRDPYLLRRIGKSDLWLVVAAWDLTDVERGALSTRVSVA